MAEGRLAQDDAVAAGGAVVHARHIAEPEAGRLAQHRVVERRRRHAPHPFDRRGRHQPAAVGERCVHSRQPPRVGDAVGAADLRAANRARIEIRPAVVGQEQLRQAAGFLLDRLEELRLEIDLGRIGGEHRRDAVVVLLGQADMEIEPERLGDVAAEECAQRFAGGEADDLADGPGEGQAVIALPRARLPVRRLGGDARDHIIPVGQSAGPDRVAEVGNGRGVRQHHLDRRLALAALAELGPQRRDLVVIGQAAGIGEQVRAERGRALGAREHHGDGIALPRRAGLRVGDAAPQVDERLAVPHDADGRPDLPPLGEVGPKRIEDGLAARRAVALNPAARAEILVDRHAIHRPLLVAARPRAARSTPIITTSAD